MSSPLIFRIFKENQLVGVKQFAQDQVVFGHNADVNIDLASDDISPVHCLIERRDSGYYVCDLGSKSGTFKNGQAILDEPINSGDELKIGPFRVSFFVGVPKPQTNPLETGINKSSKTPAHFNFDLNSNVTPIGVARLTEQADSNMPPAAVVKTEVIKIPVSIPVQTPKIVDEKPSAVAKTVRPELKSVVPPYKKKKSRKTFAPPSEVTDLKSYLTPGKGSVIEVLVAWKERILNSYHFEGKKPVTVNGKGDRQLNLPEGIFPKDFVILENINGFKVNVTDQMQVEMVNSLGIHSLAEINSSGKLFRTNQGASIRLEQNEMLCMTLSGSHLTIYVRYAAKPPVVPMLPALVMTGSEMTGVIMSVVMVALLALYISATTPKDWQESKQEEVQRSAQIIFNKPPTPVTPPPPPKVEPPSPPPQANVTPPPPEKKVVVTDQNKEAQHKGVRGEQVAKAQAAAKASEIAPKPQSKDRTKKFTSTRQGGAIKTGESAGANAQSANKDLSKVGLFSAFGGGGSRAKVDKAYTGAGEVLGMADKATGISGFNENRAGDDLGSKFKDSGAGGKGTATQGIAGVGTKGRGSGQSAYGSTDGYGSKNTVAIAGGGFEEAFDATIDKEAIRRVIKAKLNEVKSCYERALNTLEKGRKLEGKIVLGWEIIEKGQARNVKIVSSTLDNSQVENCIRDRLASWVFPEPPTGLTAVVKAYPFVLNQQN